MLSWIFWAFFLIIQNFVFTFVSRARNSGSLRRHLIAGSASSLIWFFQQTIALDKILKIMSGEFGVWMATFTGLFYMVFTNIGSIAAHYWALHSEKGLSAVGASKKYVQITQDEWKKVMEVVQRASK